MIKLIVLAMLVLSVTACSDPSISSSELDMRGTLIYERGADEPYTGLVLDRYAGGQKRRELAVVDGLPDGLMTEWHETGELRAESVLVVAGGNGQVTRTSYYRSGEKFGEEARLNDRPNGLQVSWYKNGRKKHEQAFVNGQLHGTGLSWYENGQKKFEGFFTADRPDGLETRWYENGQRESEKHYVDGRENGSVTYWYESGQKKTEGDFISGRPHGVQALWSEDGEKSDCPTMLATQNIPATSGKPICKELTDTRGDHLTYEINSGTPFTGLIVEIYQNGQMKSIETFIDGDNNGRVTLWYENGQKETELDFVRGAIEGPYTHWYENGQKSSEGSESGHEAYGLANEWYENGQKSSELNWDTGDSKRWDQDGNRL